MPQPSRAIDILLVEDNPADAFETRRTLDDCKIWNRLQTVRDGPGALACLRGEGAYEGTARPDLVLLDLGLPGMDGREVLEEIRQDAAIADVPVIVLSGSDANADIVSSFRHRADGFLVKPLDLPKLYRVIFTIDHFGMAVMTRARHEVLPEATA